MKIIIAIAFLFTVLGRVLSRNRHRQEKFDWAALLSRGGPEPCAKRPSVGKSRSKGKIHRRHLAQKSAPVYRSVFRFGACAEKRAELGRLPAGILVLSCVRRGVGVIRSPCNRSALVAQRQTHSLLFPAGKEILPKSEKAYPIVFARNTAVCRNRRTDSFGCHSALNDT